MATLGIPSLRIAYHGVGESSGRIDDFDLASPLVDDLEAARATLREFGFSRHLLIGACIGARTLCAGPLEDVVGLGLVSLPFHLESLATGSPRHPSHLTQTIQSAAIAGGEGDRPKRNGREDDLWWLNDGLIRDIDRCVRARVPIAIIYSSGEKYRWDFRGRSRSNIGCSSGTSRETIPSSDYRRVRFDARD